jgi:hypothetical protein
MHHPPVDIQVEARGLMARFDLLPKAVQAAVVRGLRRGLILAEEDVRRNAELRFSGARSGILSRLTSSVATGRSAMAVEGIIGFRKTKGFPYEMSQEFGAKARPGGAMAIPVSDEAKRLSAAGKGPRDMADLQLIKTGKGAFLAAVGHRWANQYGRSGGMLMTHYVLVKSIRPRLHFRASVEKAVPSIMAEIATEASKA